MIGSNRVNFLSAMRRSIGSQWLQKIISPCIIFIKLVLWVYVGHAGLCICFSRFETRQDISQSALLTPGSPCIISLPGNWGGEISLMYWTYCYSLSITDVVWMYLGLQGCIKAPNCKLFIFPDYWLWVTHHFASIKAEFFGGKISMQSNWHHTLLSHIEQCWSKQIICRQGYKKLLPVPNCKLFIFPDY